jgi:hypothetical protein
MPMTVSLMPTALGLELDDRKHWVYGNPWIDVLRMTGCRTFARGAVVPINSKGDVMDETKGAGARSVAGCPLKGVFIAQ